MPYRAFSISTALAFAALVLTATKILPGINGHGYMFQPESRNYWSNVNGKDYGLEAGVPIPKEYCYHCLNTKTGVCGTSEQGVNYDDWLDSLGQPMPWNSQATYQAGDIITVGMEITAHHLGHMELKACPVGDDNGRAATQDCFDQHVLEFVEDISYQMPKDEDHPERGYFYGGTTFSYNEFSMRFKLPDSLSGDKVLLQWWYYTANTCKPGEGYDEYFLEKNPYLPPEFWGGQFMPVCTADQLPPMFYSGDSPERFVNCAEVTINSRAGNDDDSGNDSSPTDAPVADNVFDDSSPTTDTPVVSPTDSPVVSPTESPVPAPTSTGGSGVGCCSNDYKTCATWCNESQESCESEACTNMKWLSNGSLENSDNPAENTCVERWGECGDHNVVNADSCCDGLVCQTINQWYSQCLHPSDPIGV